MHVLITGGAGFIGSHLTKALLERGDQVAVLDNLSTGNLENVRTFTGHPRYHLALDDLTNTLVIDRLASQADAIVHLAAAVGVQLVVERPTETIETNVLGTHLVLAAARRYRCRTLLASTSEVYGKGVSIPFREKVRGRHLPHPLGSLWEPLHVGEGDPDLPSPTWRGAGGEVAYR